MTDDTSYIKKGIGLALSGGGYRATLFTLGGLWRLNELGYLSKLTRITSVSGGSITSGVLAQHWNNLSFDPTSNVATNFKEVVANPLQEFCSKGLDVKAGISGLFSFSETISDKVAKAYDEKLFHGFEMNKLPSGTNIPEFMFYATNFQTGNSVQITKDFLYDYKLGRIDDPGLKLANVVGASSAFPPVLSPVVWNTSDKTWIDTKRVDKQLIDKYPELRKELILTDGGLYDNMGLEAIWNDDFEKVIVCDAGGPMSIMPKLKANWASQSLRMTDIMINQQRALRKRTLIQNYVNKEYGGVYFGIMTDIDDYEINDALVSDNDLTRTLQSIPTRLKKFNPDRQGYLINWGYALCDVAMRRRVNESQDFPKPKWPISEYSL